MRIVISNGADVAKAVACAMQAAFEIGFERTKQYMVATAVSELSRNIVVHSGTVGSISIDRLQEHDKRGIEVIAEDEGVGIEDIDLALRDNFSTANSLGIGLPGTKRLMDEFSIKSKRGHGTKVTVRKWV